MKITEISMFKHDGNQVIDEFTTLVNPECHVSSFITNLTGITNAMVSNAPIFHEIAEKVVQFSEDCIFVAHSVNFDYNIIKRELEDLQLEFNRKKLCTVRLSRKLIPGLRSYSLGSLCRSQGIPLIDRHRARGDAEATVILFEQLLATDVDQTVFQSFLNNRSRQATLPPLLPKETIDNLPETPGVYYFKNQAQEIIYVGKAINIKQRVISHLYDKARKEILMCMNTAQIDFQETGSELLALLLESAEIKRYFPKYNRAQRKRSESYGIFSYTDTLGILHLGFEKLQNLKNPLLKLYNDNECRIFLEELCEKFELCPKFCQLQQTSGKCNHFKLKSCRGICFQDESVECYNNRVLEAINSLQFIKEDFIIVERGRMENEKAFVLVENGVYKGFGYGEGEIETLIKYRNKLLQFQRDNKDIRSILNLYLSANSENMHHFEADANAKPSINYTNYTNSTSQLNLFSN